jgi:nucleoside-diphosphate-sugar epimerase
MDVRSVSITGGAGNLGTKIAASLAATDWCEEIVLIDRVEAAAGGKVRSVVADLCDGADARWTDVVSSVDAVVHLAAANAAPDGTWPEACLSLDMTANLVAVASRRPSRFVFASSNHVMGGYMEADLGPGELTTALPPDPGTWFHTPAGPKRYLAYAASKLMGERIVAAGAVASGGLMTGVSLRIGWCQGGENQPHTMRADGLGPEDERSADFDGYDRDLRWFRSMWLSNGDLADVVVSALVAEASAWPLPAIVVNAMSANAGMPWDIEATARTIGYNPRDNVWAHLG